MHDNFRNAQVNTSSQASLPTPVTMQNSSYQYTHAFHDTSPHLPSVSQMGLTPAKRFDVFSDSNLESTSLGTTCKKVSTKVEDLRKRTEQLQQHVLELEDTVQEMKEKVLTQQTSAKPNSKNISNKHQEVKVSSRDQDTKEDTHNSGPGIGQ